MTINKTQSSFVGGIISTEMMGRVDYEKLQSGLRQCENFIVRPVGGVQFAAGTKYVCDAVADSRLIPFSESKTVSYCLEFSDKKIRVIDDSGVKAEITTTYTAAEIQSIKYAQFQNRLYLTHENHKPAVLVHGATGAWTLTDMTFNGSLLSGTYISGITLTSGTHSSASTAVNYDKWQYAVSVADDDGNETLAVKSAYLTNDISLSQQPITVKATLKGITANITYAYFYRVQGGEFYFVQKIPLTTGQTEASFTDSGLTLDTTKSIKIPFTDFDSEYPRAVAFFNQRLIFGGTKTCPNDIWGSNIGRFDDFTKTVNLASSEAFNLTLASGTMDAIESMIPLDSLIIFSTGKIWRVDGTSASAMTATIESYSSISDLSPSATKKSILYVDASLNTISNFVYSYELNGFVGQNLDILSRELFDGYKFVAQSFRTNPFPIYFVIREDGKMMSLTYLREENIYAWSELTTNGLYKDVCCLPSQVNDKVYVKVSRKNGSFIEVFLPQIAANEDVDDGCYLHSSKIIPNCTSYTITGLTWLKGQVVYAVCGKDVVEDLLVDENGSVTIPSSVEINRRVVIGLPYRGIIQTIPFEMLDAQSNSTIGIARKICNATLMCYKTRGFAWGTSEDDMTEIKPYTENTFAETIPLETGKINLSASSNWDIDASFFIAQNYPLPCFIQNITLEIDYGSKN